MIVFLVDAQLSRKLARYLVEKGYVATHVYDHLDPEADDREIAALANSLGASVVSKDADFADLARRGLLERPFVWLRLPNLNNTRLLKAMDHSLGMIVSDIGRNQRIVELDHHHLDRPPTSQNPVR